MSLLLHLSDLHLGDVRDEDIPDDYKSVIVPLADRTSWQSMLKDTLTQLAGDLRSRGEVLDALVISGDITVRNDETGFRKLNSIFEWLGDSCPSPERIVVVPGNHDVARGVAESSEKYKLFLQYVRDKGFVTPLLEGIELRDGNVIATDLTPHFLIDPSHKWAIVPINSSHYCGSFEPLKIVPEAIWKELPQKIAAWDSKLNEGEIADEFRQLRLRDVACISRDQLIAIRAVVLAIRTKVGALNPPPVLIGVLHHQLLPVTLRQEFKAFESITNLGHLRYVLRDNNFSVVLHGHKHTESVYFDYIYKTPADEDNEPHRVFVISGCAPQTPLLTPGSIGRFIKIRGHTFAAALTLTDVPRVEHGTSLHLPEPKQVLLPLETRNAALKVAPVTLVEGDTVDAVYERAVEAFWGTNKRIPNLVCRVAKAQYRVELPLSYPPIKDIPDAQRPEWFKTIVDWWQKADFKKLSRESQFNHGNRIYSYERNVNQLERAAAALKGDPYTSRAIVSLLQPHLESIESDARFPSFCFVQFLIRDGGGRCFLETTAYFRKQEIRYWWPVNIAELAYLQSRVFKDIKESVSNMLKKALHTGAIATIAAVADLGEKLPEIMIPAVDFDFEQNARKLWDMTYAVWWQDMPNREAQVKAWQSVLNDLLPAERKDPGGVLVPIQGVEYLAEMSAHLGAHHGGALVKLASYWSSLANINRARVLEMAEEKMGDKTVSNQRHQAWRQQVVAKLNEIRTIVNEVFGCQIPELL